MVKRDSVYIRLTPIIVFFFFHQYVRKAIAIHLIQDKDVFEQILVVFVHYQQKQSPEVFLRNLEISQNSQENACARVSFLIKLQVWPATLLKKRL